MRNHSVEGDDGNTSRQSRRYDSTHHAGTASRSGSVTGARQAKRSQT
jgi:hypothetical protein